MIVRYAPRFLSKLRKVDVRIRKSFKEKILIFSKNPHNLELNNHRLREPYQSLRSIDITADWRAIYQEKCDLEKEVAYFVILGTHKELYENSN